MTDTDKQDIFEPGMSKYRCLANEIRRVINSGDLGPNNAMLADNHLMELYSVSRSTVRQAMDLLVDEGLVERRVGLGTFVKEQASMPAERTIRFLCGSFEELIRNDYMADLASGAEETVGAENIRVMADAVPKGELIGETLDGLAGSPGMKASLVLLSRYSDREVAAVVRRGIPVVTPGMDYYHLGAGCVMPSMADPSTAADLVKLMSDNGHSRIAVLQPDNASERLTRSMAQGCCNGCTAAGLPEDALRFMQVSRRLADLEQAVAALYTPSKAPDAFIAFSEPLLRNTSLVLTRRGLRIPEDVSLAGTCTVDMDPFYTSLRIDQREMGRVTAALIMAMMDDPDVLPKKRIIPHIMHAGHSVKNRQELND